MSMPEPPRTLVIELLSDSTFSRGEGTAGAVDVEVDHDRYGLPQIGGKVLHGLLREAWLVMAKQFPASLQSSAKRVLGSAGELAESSILRLGDAQLSDEVRRWARYAVERPEHSLHPDQILGTLTDVRSQTAQSRVTGSPEATTLRSTRVALRQLRFESPIEWLSRPDKSDLWILGLSVLGIRHGGLNRHRGRGFIRVTLNGDLAQTRRWACL